MNLALMTAQELAQHIVRHLDLENVQRIPFPICDFALANIEDEWSLYEIVANSEGWYGIKAIDPGFDSFSSIYLVSDYYGGLCANFFELDSGENENYVIEKITEMIFGTMKEERVGITDKLIVHFLEGETE